MRGHTREWVAQEPIQREIGRRFRNFLDRFKDDNGDLVYRDRIKDMCIREFYGMGQMGKCLQHVLPGHSKGQGTASNIKSLTQVL